MYVCSDRYHVSYFLNMFIDIMLFSLLLKKYFMYFHSFFRCTVFYSPLFNHV